MDGQEWMKLAQSIGGPFVTVTGGGVIAYFAYWLGKWQNIGVESRRTKADRQAAARLAYADWLTAQAVLSHRVQAFLVVSHWGVESKPQSKSLMDEIASLAGAMKDVLSACHRAVVLDDHPDRPRAILVVHCSSIVG